MCSVWREPNPETMGRRDQVGNFGRLPVATSLASLVGFAFPCNYIIFKYGKSLIYTNETNADLC